MSKYRDSITINYPRTEDDQRKKEKDQLLNEMWAKFYINLEQYSDEVFDGGAGQKPYLILLCYPSTDVDFFCTTGTVVTMEERVNNIYEIATFRGSSSVRLKYPKAEAVTYQPHGDFLKEKYATKKGFFASGEPYNVGDMIGFEEFNPRLSFNKKLNSIEIKPSINDDKIPNCYGNAIVIYQAKYRVLRYEPDAQKMIASMSGKDQMFAGTVFATTQESETNQVSVSVDINIKRPRRLEFARVYSNIAIDNAGAHETPDDMIQ